jgi:hypothetical protein
VQRHGATVPKVVRYYLMAAGPGSFTPDDEVDELRWLSRDEAMSILSYDRDREVLGRW